MNLGRKSRVNIMRKIGYKLGDYRRSHNLCLAHVAKQSGVPWQMIDQLELGSTAQWSAYKLLLDFYGKGIGIELVDRKPGSFRPQEISEQEKEKYRHREPGAHNRSGKAGEKEELSPPELL